MGLEPGREKEFESNEKEEVNGSCYIETDPIHRSSLLEVVAMRAPIRNESAGTDSSNNLLAAS
jgi:hypothetical protein